ncbi:MAG: hypothetical protein L0207_01450 [Chlamydiae bacterium]|nr:hypothetical protein [Chlamydiota bacterium]
MTTIAISSNEFQMTITEELKFFLERVKRSKIFSLKNLCNKFFSKNEDIPQKKKRKIEQTNLTDGLQEEGSSWEEVEKEFGKKVTPHILPLNPEDSFYNTDLLIFSDLYKGVLPLNGIHFLEFHQIKTLMSEIFSGKTRFKFDPNLSKNSMKMLARDFVILMTRKTSRELIKTIAKGSNDIFIEDGKEFKYTISEVNKDQSRHVIYICNAESFTASIGRAAQRGRKKYKIPCPSFIKFVHELIHVKHCQENVPLTKQLAEKEDASFTHLEEMRTISGWSNDYEYDFECEWTICSEFGLPVREDHKDGGTLPPGAFSEKNYQAMLDECRQLDAEIDLEKIASTPEGMP